MFKHPFYSLSGVVASEHPLASLLGSQILEKGNAVDAAIVTSLTLAVTLPHLGGLGGDFFALIMDPNGKVHFIDGGGCAPSRLTLDLLYTLGYKSMPLHGPLSINVPGMIDGLRVMWERWGALEWRELVKKVIELVRRGIIVTHSLAISLKELYNELSLDPGSKSTYYSNGIPCEGDVVAFKGLVNALELISDDPRNFYEGEIAESIVKYVKERGGVLELNDLKHYKASIGKAINIKYRGRVIYEMPPSTQGITTLHMLMLLEEYNLKTLSLTSPKRIKLLLDVAKIAYKIRDLYITDPRYMRVNVEYLLKKEFIRKVKHNTKDVSSGGSKYHVSGGDTTFFAIVDREGWIIAGIQSLFYPFGSYVTEPKFNITLNSRASSFSLDKNHVNRLESLKKTLHTLSAMIIVDYGRVIALGLSGGHFRPLLHAQLVTNILDYGLNIQEAIEYPRFVWHLWSKKVDYEEGLNVEGISNYEFSKKPYPSRLGVAAAVEVKGKVKAGYADVRGDGVAIGLP